MWNANPDFDRDYLSCVPRLRVVDVVGKLETRAEPEVAFGSVVLGVCGGELGTALNVRGVVKTDVLLHFRATVCCERGSDWARWRGLDESVAENGGDDG